MRKVWVVLVLMLSAASLFAGGKGEEGEPFERRYRDMRWEEIEAEAEGQTIYFYMWGGADYINNWVSGYLRDHLADNFGINLEMVPVDSPQVYINKVLGEKQAGKNRDGSVDIMWINGENFRTMRQADLLFGPYSDRLPNIGYCDPSILEYDFGFPQEGYESPFGSAQSVMEYDSAKVSVPPADIGELFEWARANPGKLTYAAPPDFTGSSFVRHVFYHVAGGHEALMGPFDEEVYGRIAPKVWDLLNEVKPYLWRRGETYPESSTRVQELLGNGEVCFNLHYGSDGAANNIERGTYPDTVRTYMFEDGMIGNVNFVAIGYNSGKKAAAMVMANELLNPEVQLQASMPSPEGMFWATPLDTARLPDDYRRSFEDLSAHPSRLPAEVLNRGALPEVRAEWLLRIEADWQQFVLRRKSGN
jgi:putative spermidine/putrescine transport system substrate-binding protein